MGGFLAQIFMSLSEDILKELESLAREKKVRLTEIMSLPHSFLKQKIIRLSNSVLKRSLGSSPKA